MTRGMIFKGTPGPWEVGSIIGCYIEGRNSWSHVCNVMEAHEGSVTEEESVYNRHLIASAPELLEALTRILTEYDSWKGYNDDGLEGETEALARAAIAKALGEQK